jgi:hypothetical protein
LSASTISTQRARVLPRSAWKPGQSGNPKGRPPPEVDITELARKHGPRCIEVVARLLTDKDRKLRLAAATALLDRGFGRPKQEIEAHGSTLVELHLIAARMVSGQLLEGAIAPEAGAEAPALIEAADDEPPRE